MRGDYYHCKRRNIIITINVTKTNVNKVSQMTVYMYYPCLVSIKYNNRYCELINDVIFNVHLLLSSRTKY